MTYRNRRLLDAVREMPCQFPHDWPEAAGVRCWGAVEPAHSNQLRDGKGRSLKSADYRIAACCHASHAALDQGSTLSRDARRVLWEEAHRRTIGALFESGTLRL